MQWESGPDMNHKRRAMALATYTDGHLWAIGGIGDALDVSRTTEYLVPDKGWLPGPNLNLERESAAAAVLEGVGLVVCGGYNPEIKTRSSSLNSCEVNANPSDGIADPNSWKFGIVPPMRVPRGRFALFPYKGMLVAVGGDDEREIEAYKPGAEKWVKFGSVPEWQRDAIFTYADLPLKDFNCA